MGRLSSNPSRCVVGISKALATMCVGVPSKACITATPIQTALDFDKLIMPSALQVFSSWRKESHREASGRIPQPTLTRRFGDDPTKAHDMRTALRATEVHLSLPLSGSHTS